MIVLFFLMLSTLGIAVTDKPTACPESFTLESDRRCYRYYDLPTTFWRMPFASQNVSCRSIGADLPSITSPEEQDSLRLFRDTSADQQDAIFFLGLICDDYLWKWSDNRKYKAAIANFADPEENALNCKPDNRQFVFNSNGKWEVWTNSSDPPTMICASPPNADFVFEHDVNDNDTTLGTVFAVITAVVIACVGLIIIYVCWRRRKNRLMNEMIEELTIKANHYEEEKVKTRIESIKKDDWEIERKDVAIDWDCRLGNGAFGTVYLGHLSSESLPEKAALSAIVLSSLEKSKGRVAVKMLSDSSDTSNTSADTSFLEEIDLMKSLGFHERLVNMLACVTESSPTLLIVEFCSKGDLLGHMKKCREYMISIHPQSSLDYQQIITEKQQYLFAVQIACGMEYLSAHGYVHRDIAARNILVDQNDQTKIGDFGLCRKLDNDQALYLTRGGRLPLKWMAPEALRHFEQSAASDVWSYGVLLFEIVTLGGSPYAGWTHSEILPRLEAGERMARPDNCPDVLYEIMTMCWRHRPSHRPSFTMLKEQLVDALEKMNNDTNYLQLDSQQQYYHVGSEHDQSVPEDIIFGLTAHRQIADSMHQSIVQNNIAHRENFSLFEGPQPLSAGTLIEESRSSDGYELTINSPLRNTPSPIKRPAMVVRGDSGYQIPRTSPQ